MSTAAKSDDDVDHDDEALYSGGDSYYRPIFDRLDPDSSLPVHLQGKPFDADIWERVCAHPIPNPNRTRCVRGKDCHCRELVREILAAANDREKAVLMHNQARVFREMLARVFDSIGTFLSRPLVPASWIDRPVLISGKLISSRPSSTGEGEPGNADEAADPSGPREAAEAGEANEEALPEGEAKAASGEANVSKAAANKAAVNKQEEATGRESSGRWWSPVALALLTPKYIFTVLAIALALLAGYKQIQVYNLQEAIDSYKVSAAATDGLREEMHQLISSASQERADHAEELEALRVELAAEKAESLRIDQARAAAVEGLSAKEADLGALQGELQSYRNQQSVDVQDLQSKYDAAEKAKADAERLLAEALSKITGLDGRIADQALLETQVRSLLETKEKEVDELKKNYSDQFYKRASLEKMNTVLRFAESAIQDIRSEVDVRGSVDKTRVMQHLNGFTAAKKNILSTSAL